MSPGGRAAIVAGAVALAAIGAGATAPCEPLPFESAPFELVEARPPLQRIEASEPHMGTLVRVVGYAESTAAGEAAARAAFDRVAALDASLSDYRDTSEVAAVAGAAAGVPIAISEDLFTLLAASEALARRTGGAFDVTAGRLTHLWRRARRLNIVPEPQEVEAARTAGGYAKVHLDATRRTVTLAARGIELDLGGIAKGYAAEAALGVLRARGVGSALVAIGGDIAAGDPPPGRPSWTVAIPLVASATATAPLIAGPSTSGDGHWIGLANAAVSTSGDAEQWLTAGGVRYSHVIDLRTGWPLTGRRSTSVVAARGRQADALSTVLGVLDAAAGKALLRDLAAGGRLAALWQQVAAGGRVATDQTSNWPTIVGPAPVATP